MDFTFVVPGQSNGVALAPRLQAKADLAFPNDNVTVIPAAVGGTTLYEWQKGYGPNSKNGRPLYEDMIEAIDGRHVDLIVLWIGESHAQNETEAKWLRQGFLYLHDDWRLDINPDALIFIMNMGQDPDPTRETYPNWWDCYASFATFNNIPSIPPLPAVKVLSTLHLPCDPVVKVHKTPAGLNTAANNILTKFKNIRGL